MAHIEFGEGLQDGYVLSTDSILAGIQRYYDNNLEVNCTSHTLYWREGWCIAIGSNTVLLLTDDSRNVILILVSISAFPGNQEDLRRFRVQV